MDYKHQLTIWTRDVGSASDEVHIEMTTAVPMSENDVRDLLTRAAEYARREFLSSRCDTVARAIEKVCPNVRVAVLQRTSFSFETGELIRNGGHS